MASALNITFPGNLAQVQTAAQLRSVPSSVLLLGTLFLVNELEGLFRYDPGSLGVDDGADIIRPNDKSALQAGRWIRNAASFASGGSGGDAGPFAELPTQNVPVGTSIILTSGPTYGVSIEDTTLTDADIDAYPRGMRKTKNGRKFRRDLYTVDVRKFGAVGDARLPNGDPNPNPTDDLPAFKAAIAYVQRFAVNPAGNVQRGAAQVTVPPGAYFWSDTLEVRGGMFRLQGFGSGKNTAAVSRIILPPNKTAMIVQRFDTYGPSGPSGAVTFGSEGMIIDGMTFESQGGNFGNDRHGVIFRGRGTFTHNQVIGFPGSGLFAVTAAGSQDFQGNTNCMTVAENGFFSNGVCGAQYGGSDTNAGSFTGNDCAYNGRFGFLDTSLLGNYVAGNHFDANGVRGFGGNTVGSSVVRFGPNNERWYVMPGQDVAASTTQPGTNAAVWGVFPGGPGVQSGHPLWYSGIPVFSGGPLAITNINNGLQVTGCYAEGGQAPATLARGVVSQGCNWKQAVGVVEASPGQKYCDITSAEGSVSNVHGFVSDNGVQRVSLNKDGYLSEMITPEFPAGWQWQRSGTDVRLTYGGSDANELWRRTGFATNNPVGPRRALTDRLAIGIGMESMVATARAAKPTGDDFPRGSLIWNSNPNTGIPDYWRRRMDGVWVDGPLIP